VGQRGTVQAGDYIFFYGRGNKSQQLGTGFFLYHRILSAVNRGEFVSNRMSFIVLRDLWCKIIVFECTYTK